MNWDKLFIVSGVTLAATVSFWIVLPVVGYLMEIFLAIALIVLIIDGYRKSIIAAVSLGFVIGIVPGVAPLPFDIFLSLWIKAIIPAVVLGILISRGWHAGRSFGIAVLLLSLVTLVIYSYGGEIIIEQIEVVRQSLHQSLSSTLQTHGYSEEIINDFKDTLGQTAFLIKHLLPGLLIMSGFSQLFIAFIIIELYYTRRDSYFPGFGPFIYWKIPEKIIYSLGFVLIIRLTIEGVLQTAADNFIFILSFMYAICGLALIEYLLRRLQLPTFIKIVFYLGLFFMQLPGMMIASVAGLFDSYFDFRKVKAHSLG